MLLTEGTSALLNAVSNKFVLKSKVIKVLGSSHAAPIPRRPAGVRLTLTLVIAVLVARDAVITAHR